MFVLQQNQLGNVDLWFYQNILGNLLDFLNEFEIDTGTTLHLWEEIDKIEAVSDVDEDSDMDTGATGESGSLQSVPRPSIRPFFGHTGSSEETLSLVS
ncbi:hypothetical protein ACTXT7_011373 [Hymenolepis weldensis]